MATVFEVDEVEVFQQGLSSFAMVGSGVAGTTEISVAGPQGAPGAAGSPTAFELRGTGFPEGSVTASPGTYYTDTAGTVGAWRWLKMSGSGNTGWKVTVGDTGWRNVGGVVTWIAPNFTSGQVLVRRVNECITYRLRISSATSPGNVNTDVFNASVLGADWNVVFPDSVSFSWGRENITLMNASFHFDGIMKSFQTWGSGYLDHSMRGEFNFVTDRAWPTTLPGTAA